MVDHERRAGAGHGAADAVRGVGRPTAIAALGGFLFGYDTGVISAALLYIGPELGLNDASKQLVVGSLLAGALLGALCGGAVADRLGRRPTLAIASIVFILGAVVSAVASGLLVLVIGRVLLGLAIGVSSVTVPVYIAELAPKRVRGRLASMNQFMITAGIFVSYLVGYAFAPIEGWRWMLGLAAVPSLAMLVGLLGIGESPRWLALHGRRDEARRLLRSTRGTERGDEELDEIIRVAEEERRWSWADLTRPALRPALIVGVGVAAANQLVGVNAVIYYAPTILQGIFGDVGAILSTVGIGLVNVVVTFIALRRIDRWGRRPLLLGGLAAVVISLFALAGLFLVADRHGVVGYAIVIFLCIYIAAFAASLGLAIWLVNSEIYPTMVRGKASSLGSTTHWALDLVIASTVLTMISTLSVTGMFGLFGVIGVAALVFLYKRMPETKGRSLEEIDAALRASARGSGS